MLTCNNCGEINPMQASSCHHCKMAEALVPKVNNELIDAVEKEREWVQCLNCGEDTDAEESKCQCCSFPLPNKTLGNKIPKPRPLVKSMLKTA